MNLKQKYLSLSENNKIVLRNTFAAFVVKGAALLVSLFTMPAYMSYFDNEAALGLWFTILSVLNWILNFDLGIGNGLRNHLTQAFAQKDEVAAKKYISSAYFSIGCIVLLLIVAGEIAFPYIPWNKVFNIDGAIVSDTALLTSVRIVYIGIMIQFFLRLISSILYAMQKSAFNNFISLLSSVSMLLFVWIAPSRNADLNLITLSWVNILTVNVPLLLMSVWIFFKRLKKCRPNIKYCKKESVNAVLRLGGMFFWVQIVYMIIMNTNEYLISWFTQPDYVVKYQVYNKLFTLIGTVFNLALTPIWSAVTKALAEREYKWLKSLNKKLILLACFATACEFLMIPMLNFIVKIWLGDKAIAIHYGYAAVFAVLGSMMIWNGVLSSIANGLGRLKPQMIFFTLGAIVKIPVAWVLTKYTSLSWISIILATDLALIGYLIVQAVDNVRYLKMMNRRPACGIIIAGKEWSEPPYAIQSIIPKESTPLQKEE